MNSMCRCMMNSMSRSMMNSKCGCMMNSMSRCMRHWLSGAMVTNGSMMWHRSSIVLRWVLIIL